MSNFAKLARPYAKAAFEYAVENQQVEKWSQLLRKMAEYVQQPTVVRLLKNPQYSMQQQADICIALGHDILNQAGQHFVKILAKNRRLLVLPNISQLFEQLRSVEEKTLVVQIKSAIPLSDEYRQKLDKLLTDKFACQIVSHYEVDSQVIGGLLIHAGDQVIDGTVRGQLVRLREAVINSF